MTHKPHHKHYEYVTAAAWDFLCLFRREAGGAYRVTSPEMPALLAFGDTLAEARDNAREELVICLRKCQTPDDPLREPRLSGWRTTSTDDAER
jgi:predicted RNase H-like HicB family nuclease